MRPVRIRGFNQVACFLGTLQEARAAGYDMDQPPGWTRPEQQARSMRSYGNVKEWKCSLSPEPIHVKLPDKILYASDNVKITGRLTAVVNRSWTTAVKSADAAVRQNLRRRDSDTTARRVPGRRLGTRSRQARQREGADDDPTAGDGGRPVCVYYL